MDQAAKIETTIPGNGDSFDFSAVSKLGKVAERPDFEFSAGELGDPSYEEGTLNQKSTAEEANGTPEEGGTAEEEDGTPKDYLFILTILSGKVDAVKWAIDFVRKYTEGPDKAQKVGDLLESEDEISTHRLVVKSIIDSCLVNI